MVDASGGRFSEVGQRGGADDRRAIAVLATPATAALTSEIGREAAASIAVYALLDLLAILVPLDGVNIAVVCIDPEHAELVAGVLPAGIDVLLAPSGGQELPSLMQWALTTHFERGFDRVLALVGDVMDIPARTVATALGALDSADVVISPSQNGDLYLISLRSPAAVELFDDGERSAAVLFERAKARGLTARRVEPRRRMADLAGIEAIREMVATDPAALPRLSSALRQIAPPAE